MPTATDAAMRMNARHRRAQVLLHEIMSRVSPHLCDHQERDPRRDVLRSLEELFMQEGVEVLTDRTREDLGLPARGPDGWTVEELVALEKSRLDAITRSMAPPVIYVTKEQAK